MADLGQFVNGLDAYANQLIQQATLEAQGYALRNLDEIVVETVRSARRATSQQLVQLADAIDRGVAPADRLRLHESLGRAGQASVLGSFDQTKGRSTSNPAYNRAAGGNKYRRYAGGRLRAALASGEFWSATADELNFINVELLNRRAAQWARVNFGAGNVGQGSRPAEGVYLGSMLIATLGLEEEARPAFTMPVGYFVDNGGEPVATRTPGAAFFVYQNGPFRRGQPGGGIRYKAGDEMKRIPMVKRQTVGIVGRQFLDAGVQRIAREMGPGYQELYRRFYQQAETTIRPYRLNPLVRTVR